jgi:hypothetical protein
LSIALSRLFIRMLLLRDPLGRNSIRVKKRRSDTTYLRVPRPRRCAAAIAQLVMSFGGKTLKHATVYRVSCLITHQSSAQDHTTCGNDDRDRRERSDRSETYGSTHDPPLGHDRTERVRATSCYVSDLIGRGKAHPRARDKMSGRRSRKAEAKDDE